MKVVFPALRESLEKDCIHLVDIDVRWGVIAEQPDNDRVLDLCLQQIDKCRPLAMGIPALSTHAEIPCQVLLPVRVRALSCLWPGNTMLRSATPRIKEHDGS